MAALRRKRSGGPSARGAISATTGEKLAAGASATTTDSAGATGGAATTTRSVLSKLRRISLRSGHCPEGAFSGRGQEAPSSDGGLQQEWSAASTRGWHSEHGPSTAAAASAMETPKLRIPRNIPYASRISRFQRTYAPPWQRRPGPGVTLSSFPERRRRPWPPSPYPGRPGSSSGWA